MIEKLSAPNAVIIMLLLMDSLCYVTRLIPTFTFQLPSHVRTDNYSCMPIIHRLFSSALLPIPSFSFSPYSTFHAPQKVTLSNGPRPAGLIRGSTDLKRIGFRKKWSVFLQAYTDRSARIVDLADLVRTDADRSADRTSFFFKYLINKLKLNP